MFRACVFRACAVLRVHSTQRALLVLELVQKSARSTCALHLAVCPVRVCLCVFGGGGGGRARRLCSAGPEPSKCPQSTGLLTGTLAGYCCVMICDASLARTMARRRRCAAALCDSNRGARTTVLCTYGSSEQGLELMCTTRRVDMRCRMFSFSYRLCHQYVRMEHVHVCEPNDRVHTYSVRMLLLESFAGRRDDGSGFCSRFLVENSHKRLRDGNAIRPER